MIHRQLLVAMRHNYHDFMQLLLQNLTEEDLDKCFEHLFLYAPELLPLAANQLPSKTKLELLKNDKFIVKSWWMPRIIAVLLQDPSVQHEIHKEFTLETRILNPVFVRALAYHLSEPNNIFCHNNLDHSLWKFSFHHPALEFQAMMDRNFVTMNFMGWDIIRGRSLEQKPIKHVHFNSGYVEMTEIRVNGREIFPDTYKNLQNQLHELLVLSLDRNDFPLYTSAIHCLMVSGMISAFDTDKYTKPCVIDPDWCQSKNQFSSTLILSLTKLKEMPETKDFRSLLNNFFNNKVTLPQYNYAKALGEDKYRELTQDEEVNRLVLCFSGNILSYLAAHPSQSLLVAVLLDAITCLSADVNGVIASYLSTPAPPATLDAKLEPIELPCLRSTAGFEYVAKEFILEDVNGFLQATQGTFSSFWNSKAREILYPLKPVIALLQSDAVPGNCESGHYLVQICLFLLTNPEAQRCSEICALTEKFRERVVGEDLIAVLKSKNKEAKAQVAALQRGIIDQMTVRVRERSEFGCTAANIATLARQLEASLKKSVAPKSAVEFKRS